MTHYNNKPLELRVATSLGLEGGLYASEYFWPYDYHEPGFLQRYKQELGELALQAVQEGRLSGPLGLEYVESDMFAYHANEVRNELAYHGSPHILSTIQRRQATWHDTDPAQPYRFIDGQPAICASPTTEFPAMRALLHEAHPEVAIQSLQLRKCRDRQGRWLWFTSEETLAGIKAEGVAGQVYAFSLRAAKIRDDQELRYDPSRDEYRIYGQRQVLARVPVGPDALPTDLCVIPSDGQAQLRLMQLYDHVLRWSKATGVPVRPLGGLWPKEYAE
jgi:hypothetical protein